MIWVEILSRHREVVARVRIVGEEAIIGRGYDNDVIVDDPYVAARHLRVFRALTIPRATPARVPYGREGGEDAVR